MAELNDGLSKADWPDSLKIARDISKIDICQLHANSPIFSQTLTSVRMANTIVILVREHPAITRLDRTLVIVVMVTAEKTENTVKARKLRCCNQSVVTQLRAKAHYCFSYQVFEH